MQSNMYRFLLHNGWPHLKWSMKLLVFGCVGVVLLFSCDKPKKKINDSITTPYNVMFISVDDLRPALGCYGNAVVKTPNIDKLAASAMVFNRAYSQAAVCMPSRASIMSSIRPENFKKKQLNGGSMDENVPNIISLADFFKQQGYQTISIGKIYHHNNDDKDGWSKRYTETFIEEKFGGNGYASGYTDSIHQKAVYNYLNAWSNKSLLDSIRPPASERADIPDSLHVDGKVTKLAIKELKRLKEQGGNFFLAPGYYRPHLPFTPPKKYWDMYNQDNLEVVDNPFSPKEGLGIHDWEELRRYGNIPDEGTLSEEKAKELIHGYYASVSFIDAQIGELLDTLERLELFKNTLVVLWGDHGWNLGEHGLWCKHSNYETSTRTPLIIKVPGVTNGKTSESLVGLIDVYPTLANLVSDSIPSNLDGESLVPILLNKDYQVKEEEFMLYFNSYSMRTNRYRFTRFFEPQKLLNSEKDTVGIYELYDHKIDPEENINLAYQPEYKDLVENLKKRMENKGYLKNN